MFYAEAVKIKTSFFEYEGTVWVLLGILAVEVFYIYAKYLHPKVKDKFRRKK
jgi:hypothetical protein